MNGSSSECTRQTSLSLVGRSVVQRRLPSICRNIRRYSCPRPKEPHFFVTDLPGISKQIYADEGEYINACFGHGEGRSYRAVGEASVWQLYSRDAVGNILRFNPAARFIVCVRNPIDMAFSLHGQHVFFGKEDIQDFRLALQASADRRRGLKKPKHLGEYPLECILYDQACSLGTQLERLMGQVDPGRLLVVGNDDLGKDTRGTYERVLQFLDVPSDDRRHFPRVNETRRIGNRFLADTLRSRVVVRSAIEVKKVLQIRTFGFGRPSTQMTVSERKVAEEVFCDEVKTLQRLLGCDLEHWIAPRTPLGYNSGSGV